jgi:two-component sensor histidine kinase
MHTQAAERIQSFLMKLEADLPRDLRNTIGLAFRELLLNAVEWGGPA